VSIEYSTVTSNDTGKTSVASRVEKAVYHIVTLKEFFVAPNGKQYKAICGVAANGASDGTLRVGTATIPLDNILMIIKSNTLPYYGSVEDWVIVDGEVKSCNRPTLIYYASPEV